MTQFDSGYFARSAYVSAEKYQKMLGCVWVFTFGVFEAVGDVWVRLSLIDHISVDARRVSGFKSILHVS